MSRRGEYTSVSLAEGEQGEVLDASVVPAGCVATTARPLMEVIAPATLQEGFEFDVTVGPNNQTVKVEVPLGGVEQGQKFQVPFPEKAHPALPTGVTIPVGDWRDGLCHCFKHGICHPHLWTSFCCPLLAVGQVIHRMQLDWTGQVTNNPRSKAAAFTIIVSIVVVDFIIRFAMPSIMAHLAPEQKGSIYFTSYLDQDDVPLSALVCVFLIDAWMIIIGWGILIISCNARRAVRKRYAIPSSDDPCGGDCACIYFCHCCAVAQMLRHTTDYEVYPSYCLSASGIPPSAPAIV